MPFHATRNDKSKDRSYFKNDTEEMLHWEWIIEVAFVPGLGGMKEE